MTQEFLFFANLTLLLRLKLLLVDQPAGAGQWWIKAAIEVLALLGFAAIDRSVVIAALASVAFNIAALLWDRRGRADRNAAHLALGLLHLAVLSVCFAPASGADFRPWLGEAARVLAQWSAVGPWLLRLTEARMLAYVLGLLLAANEANLFIRWILGRLQLRPGLPAAQGLDTNEFARGRVIGLLERVLIYFFVLNGHYGAVGFTLAAKGFTRFKELENRAFAEYVLIGTLLSSGLAILIAVAVRGLTQTL